MDKYDLVVIGTGTAGSSVASRCRRAGWRVAIADVRPFGGTCALRGCDPKKVLLAMAEAVDWHARLSDINIFSSTPPRVDWSALMRHKRSFTDPVPANREQRYQKLGIDALHGSVKFEGPNRLRLDQTSIEAAHVLIATGAEAAHLPIEGSEHFATNEDFLSLDALPHRLVIVGGGFIAFEFAHIAARAGAEVEILEMSAQPLSRFDPDLVAAIVERSAALGIHVRVHHKVRSIVRDAHAFTVSAEGPDGTVQLEADLVVHGGGRVPAVVDLDLDAGEIAHDGPHIKLNPYLQSETNLAVYAAGDSAGTPLPLTPVAALEGKIVADNLLHGNLATPNYAGIPSVVFTVPPLARVGLLEFEAQKQDLKYEVAHGKVGDWFTARRMHEPCYAYKTLVEKDTGRILGAHLAGPDAAETINLFAMAMQHGLTAQVLRDTIMAYPTAASDLAYMLPPAT